MYYRRLYARRPYASLPVEEALSCHIGGGLKLPYRRLYARRPYASLLHSVRVSDRLVASAFIN